MHQQLRPPPRLRRRLEHLPPRQRPSSQPTSPPSRNASNKKSLLVLRSVENNAPARWNALAQPAENAQSYQGGAQSLRTLQKNAKRSLPRPLAPLRRQRLPRPRPRRPQMGRLASLAPETVIQAKPAARYTKLDSNNLHVKHWDLRFAHIIVRLILQGATCIKQKGQFKCV